MSSPWGEIIVKGSGTFDPDQTRRALGMLTDRSHAFEIRGINPPGRAHGIICHTIDDGIKAVDELSNFAGVYLALNPVKSDAKSASKSTVTSRRWFFIDVDPVRPKDTSATESEKEAASGVVIAIIDYLIKLGWPAPIIADSGNGWHLYYRVDLPNDKLTDQIVKQALYALADKLDTSEAKIDRATHDAPRIAKLAGTWARKGTNSPDRPYRMARLISFPDQPEIVPTELIRQLAGGDKPTTNGQSPDPWNITVGRNLDSYVRRAIEAECGKVAVSPEGSRNAALNAAAFSLAQLSGWSEFDDGQAKSMLEMTALRAGLGDREIALTIASGWAAGVKLPRQRPTEQGGNGKPNGTPLSKDVQLISWGHETQSKTVKWLWDDRIALGFISIFAGKTGVGKSFILCDIAAKLTTGRQLPGETGVVDRGPVRVLIISEDPKEYVLVPRLMELKADLSRIAFMTWEAMAEYTLGDIEMLDRAYHQAIEPILIIIDPPANFLGKKDQNKDAEVRSIVMRLVAWLDTKGVASVFVTHINKQINKMVEALDRIMGSIAWGTTSRVAVGFAPDPNTHDQCLCVGIKNNLGEKASTLAYKITKTSSLATVDWVGPSDVTADDAMSQTKRKSRGECCVEWLTGKFREKVEWESEELKRMAFNEGFSKNSLWSPEVNALPIKKKRRTNAAGDDYWVWRADDGWPPPEKNNGKDGNVGNVEPQPVY